MTGEKMSATIADSLGPDAYAAYKAGTHWEYKPESVEAADPWAEACDNKDCPHDWHKTHYVMGYEITNGRVYEVIHICDMDGEWSTGSSIDVDEPAYKKWREDFSEEKRQAGWLEYAEYVARTGTDPLGNYIVITHHKSEWVARFQQDEHGLRFLNAYEAKAGTTIHSDHLNMPADIRKWLVLGADGYIDDPNLRTIDRLRGDHFSTIRLDDDTVMIGFSLQREDAAELISLRRREAARRHLDEKGGSHA